MASSTSSWQNRILVDNTVWLVASIFLAMVVWVTAELDIDPIVQERLDERVEIQILTNPDVILTNPPTNRARVTVRAQRTTLNEITFEDVEVIADARGISEPGQHRVFLEGRVENENQATVVEIIPAQITLELAQREERFVPLVVRVTDEAPASVQANVTPVGGRQVLISGPAEAVSQVDEVRVLLDLSETRESTTLELNPIPVDVDNNNQVISNIAIEPETVTLEVGIEQRSDVREVRVTPNLVGTPPEGYTLTSTFTYEPETVFISGPPELLESLPGTLFTQPIDLSQYTDRFEIRVPVELPNERLVLITGQRIEVEVGIAPVQTSRQFERIPVEIIGLAEGLEVSIAPSEVSVLVNGPQPIVSALQASDVRVIVDLNSLSVISPLDEGANEGVDTIQVEPVATVGNGQIEEENVSVLPPTIDVQILSPDDTAVPEDG